MENRLNELVEKLRAAGGSNVKSVVLYGSAVSGEFHPRHSDLNVLCILEKAGGEDLRKLSPVTAWWGRKGHPVPLVFTLDSLRRSADVFAIEFLDIKASRRVLYGEDVFATLEIPMALHRIEVERELRVNLLRLRQSFLAGPPAARQVLHLMTSSVSTFAALFRHVLLAMGEEPPQQKREVVNRLAGLLGFKAAPFHNVLGVREGKLRDKDLDVGATFRGYLDCISHVTDEVDQRLQAG